MAQRQRRDWRLAEAASSRHRLVGDMSRRDSFSIMHHFWQNAYARERRSHCPLEPVLGGLANFVGRAISKPN
jgi:hypothetical protein